MKIDKLEIKNFKFFDELEPLDFESENILLYGENGSGKSTIYWALYTLLQSSIKDNTKIKEYFTHSTSITPNNSSLVNIYANDDNSKIELFIKGIEEQFIISKNMITIKNNEIIKKSLYTSDFINYKYLFRFFNFLHRDEINLFNLFEYEILHFLNDSDSNTNLYNLWKEILELEKEKPSDNIKTKSVYKKDYNDEKKLKRAREKAKKEAREKNEKEYEKISNLTDKINNFNKYLNNIIPNLNDHANKYLRDKFGYNNLKLQLSIKEGRYEKENNEFPYIFYKPEINIELSVSKNEIYEVISRPQSYFNEAKLTAIALSVRLAITKIKLKDSPLKLLVLDDLLVSLDMSNRNKVLDILLNDENLRDYQKIILTHDRSFFEMAKIKLGNNNWKTFEMYVEIDKDRNFEKPFIKKSLNYFESAEKHFEEYDYPACANYLRKEVERIKKIVNQNDRNGIPVNRSMQIVKRLINSEDFVKFSRPNSTDEACIGNIRGKLIGIKRNLDNAREPSVEINMQEINSILHRILHPQSHDDTSQPLYKKELEEAIQTIKRLRENI